MYQMGPINIISNINAQIPWSVPEERTTEGRPKSSILVCLLGHLLVVAPHKHTVPLYHHTGRVWGWLHSVNVPTHPNYRNTWAFCLPIHSESPVCWGNSTDSFSQVLAFSLGSLLPASLPPSSPCSAFPSFPFQVFILSSFSPPHLSSLRFPFPLPNFKNWALSQGFP